MHGPLRGIDRTENWLIFLEPILFGVHTDIVKLGKNVYPVLKDGIICSKGEVILATDDKADIAELFEAIRIAE